MRVYPHDVTDDAYELVGQWVRAAMPDSYLAWIDTDSGEVCKVDRAVYDSPPGPFKRIPVTCERVHIPPCLVEALTPPGDQ